MLGEITLERLLLPETVHAGGARAQSAGGAGQRGLTPRPQPVDSLHVSTSRGAAPPPPKGGAMAAHRWLKIGLVASLATGGVTCSDESGPGPVSMDRVAGRGTSLSFTNTPLLRPDGSSEPAISIGLDGTMGLSGLSWTQFFTNVWKGLFGSTPVFQGQIDAHIGKSIGGGDADLDLGSTGTLHATTLVFFFNPTFNALQLGVSAITCPNANTANDFASCKAQILDQTQSDRQWVTSDGARVYISYHDAGSSTLIHVQRSDDDGFNFKRVGDPVVAQGGATGDATFNNDQGPIVADPVTHNVYDVYAAGEPGIQKGTTATFNNIFVSRSTDLGKSWTANKVFSASLFTAPNNVFPSRAGGHRRLPLGRGSERDGGCRVLWHQRLEQGRSERCVERISGTEHQRRRKLPAGPSHRPPEPRGRDLHQWDGLRAGDAQSARPVRGGDRSRERPHRHHLHR